MPCQANAKQDYELAKDSEPLVNGKAPHREEGKEPYYG